MIEINNLVKDFSTTRALDNLNLTINPGETTVIMGPSGSGKSTLLRCLNLLEWPDEGTISFTDDVSVNFPNTKVPKNTVKAVRNHSTMIFQGFHLFPHLNVLRNVTLAPMLQYSAREKAQPPVEELEARALELLDIVGLRDRAESYPSQLSGGQQQRVAIARALALEPEYLLCDEPTSALDPELAAGVSQVLRDVAAKEQSMVVVTHDMSFARRVADRAVFLVDGQLRYDGDPDGFFGSSDERIQQFLAVYN